MTPLEYKTERQKRGSQESVAAQLGVVRSSIARRESGQQPINQEAALAMLAIPILATNSIREKCLAKPTERVTKPKATR